MLSLTSSAMPTPLLPHSRHGTLARHDVLMSHRYAGDCRRGSIARDENWSNYDAPGRLVVVLSLDLYQAVYYVPRADLQG